MFCPTDPSLRTASRPDSNDPRVADFVRFVSPDDLTNSLTLSPQVSPDSGRPFVLAGYADDEGIRLSGGRIGAAAAPRTIRRHLFRMTPSALSPCAEPVILDVGDLRPDLHPITDRHEAARRLAFAALSRGARWLALGGGHDYGYADASAFSDLCALEGERPLVLNFDAHLDVRPYPVYSSGTPFSRWLDAYPESDFAEIGLQGQCNARAHCDWVRARGGRLLFCEDLEAGGETLLAATSRLLGSWLERRRKAFISIDIDAFSSAYAPGCSQSFAGGLEPSGFFPLLQVLLKRLDVRALAIYETSPPLDADDRTSKLAAQILHRTIFAI